MLSDDLAGHVDRFKIYIHYGVELFIGDFKIWDRWCSCSAIDPDIDLPIPIRHRGYNLFYLISLGDICL